MQIFERNIRSGEIGEQRRDAIAFAADVPHAYVNPASEECWMNLVMTYATA